CPPVRRSRQEPARRRRPHHHRSTGGGAATGGRRDRRRGARRGPVRRPAGAGRRRQTARPRSRRRHRRGAARGRLRSGDRAGVRSAVRHHGTARDAGGARRRPRRCVGPHRAGGRAAGRLLPPAGPRAAGALHRRRRAPCPRPRAVARHGRARIARARPIRPAGPSAGEHQHAGRLCPDTIRLRMILPVHAVIRSTLVHLLTDRFQLAPDELPEIVLEIPPKRAFGDLAAPVAFELARRLRKAPRAIAQELAGAIGPIPAVARVEAAPSGYLNFFLDRAACLQQWLAPAPARTAAPEHGKVIVEHTAINPNKAAHIGHLRNATLGDTLVRLLRFQGRPVEVQNYIDDTGVQVADVVVGLTELEGRDLASVQGLAESAEPSFDYYCWDLYARVTEWYAGDEARLEVRRRVLHDVEHGGNARADIAAFVADRIVRCHLRTMARLNVDYDLLTWEGDILRLHFWATAFEQLKARNSVFLQTEGRLAG